MRVGKIFIYILHNSAMIIFLRPVGGKVKFLIIPGKNEIMLKIWVSTARLIKK